MIPLRIRAEAPSAVAPFVVRVGGRSDPGCAPSAAIVSEGPSFLELSTPAGPLRLSGIESADCTGDVLLIFPSSHIAHRLIRANSIHNTLLVTEQCDQTCLMCSQPPKKQHTNLYPLFEAASLLAPSGAVIGISGGEPTLHKSELLNFLTRVLSRRPDLSFHVLTNAQHFSKEDMSQLSSRAFQRVTWGIPIYADSSLHDAIVKKEGAFDRLLKSFSLLARSGAMIELRTVLLQQNVQELPSLASFVASQLPFISRWAIMQLENIGFARQAWPTIFFDHSTDFSNLATAINIARVRAMDVRLYNFPLCTVPRPYRHLADATISDWKRRYLEGCVDCSVRDSCTGFFAWYPERQGFRNILAQ